MKLFTLFRCSNPGYGTSINRIAIMKTLDIADILKYFADNNYVIPQQHTIYNFYAISVWDMNLQQLDVSLTSVTHFDFDAYQEVNV